MVNPVTYLTLGGVGVSLAGFASLLVSLRGAENTDRLMAWRIRYIVTGGFAIAIASLGVVAVEGFSNSQVSIVRISTLFIPLVTLFEAWSYKSLNDRAVFRSRSEAIQFVAGGVVVGALVIANLVFAEPALMLATWILIVASPMTIFINVVGTIYTPPSGAAR